MSRVLRSRCNWPETQAWIATQFEVPTYWICTRSTWTTRTRPAISAGYPRSYEQGTLERLARHQFREVRRAAVLALGFLGDYMCNHTMGRSLLDDDRTVRTLAENGIRSVWTRMGDEPDRQELAEILRLGPPRNSRKPSFAPPS